MKRAAANDDKGERLINSLEIAPGQEKTVEMLSCSICHEIVQNGVCCKHGHIFCRNCIDTWLAKKKTCPVDSLKLLKGDLNSIPVVLKNMIDELKVVCPNKKTGCAWVNAFGKLEEHLKECQHRSEPCRACGVSVLVSDKNHPQVCPSRLVACVHCKIKVPLDKMEVHVQKICAVSPFVPEECVCNKTLPRGEIEKHVAADFYGHLRKMEEKQRKVISSLEEKNLQLTKAKDLELRSMRTAFSSLEEKSLELTKKLQAKDSELQSARMAISSLEEKNVSLRAELKEVFAPLLLVVLFFDG